MSELHSSVLIPVYNQHPEYLRACLRSAMRQRCAPANYEVIVVDDGSDSSCEPIVEAVRWEVYAPAFDCADLRYIRQINGGVAAALNTALSKARGTYIHWLSSDDLFHPDKVAGQTEAMQREGAQVSYCAYEDGVPQAQTVWPAVQHPSQEALLGELRKQCSINACTVVWETAFLREIGGFDASFRHCQDYEVLLRSATRANFLAVHELWVRRRTHPGQMLNALKQKGEAEIKAVELARLNEMYGVMARLWVPT